MANASDTRIVFAVNQLQELLKMPCWGVRHGYASSLHLEFGSPHLEIRSPNRESKRRVLQKRSVAVEGEWSLWIDCCKWTYKTAGCEIANSESSNENISSVVKQIDSQMLLSIHISSDSGATSIRFEDHSVLQTTPYSESYELWSLFTPSGEVVGVKTGGFISVRDKSTTDEDGFWTKLLVDIDVVA